MRATTKMIPAPLGTRAFVHSTDFLDIEQYKSIGREALMNIGLGFAMIAVVVMLLVANPTAAVLTFLCVASSILELVGFMHFRCCSSRNLLVSHEGLVRTSVSGLWHSFRSNFIQFRS